MQQSSVIFAYLLIAYLLFITMRGELPDYITLLRGGGKQGGANATQLDSFESQVGKLIGGSNPAIDDFSQSFKKSFDASLDNSSDDYLTELTRGR